MPTGDFRQPFTPQQTAEIQRMINEALRTPNGPIFVDRGIRADLVDPPPPTEEEKGDLERAISELRAHAERWRPDVPTDASPATYRQLGILDCVTILKSMLPGQDLARAKKAEGDAAYWKDSTFSAAKLIAEIESKLAKVEEKLDNLRRAHDLWKEEARRYAENCSRAEIKLATAESKLAKVEEKLARAMKLLSDDDLDCCDGTLMLDNDDRRKRGTKEITSNDGRERVE